MEKRIAELTGELAQVRQELHSEIGKRKLAEQKYCKAKVEAVAATNAKYEFLANMSHEFRLPMNHIIGFTEILLAKKYGDLNNDQEEYLKDVLQSSNHLLCMLSDILDLVQVDAGKSELDLAETNMKLILEKCIAAFKERAKEQRLSLTMDLDRLPESAFIDKHKFRRIIHNLLSNAIKFTPEGGSVNLKARIEGHTSGCNPRWENPEPFSILGDSATGTKVLDNGRRPCLACSVSDTGIGIEPENHDRIFNIFEQLDASSEKYYQGIGLGLALAKRFVEMHGGRIVVKSEGRNRGSVFRFTIPLEV
jgi:signal transduction histidine kinase